MKKFLLFLLLAGSVLAFGQEQKFVTVEARGMGTSPDAATRDALSQAVQQAAGAIVDSQTLMKNDEIMQEKILTASNAIVKKYDVVVPVKQNRNGLYEIRIKAEVEQNLLRQKLIEHKIIEGKVEGTQNIWAEVVTQEKNQVDMQAMIENTISKIDVRKYLRFNIIGVNRKMGNEARLYMKQLPNNNRKVRIEAGLVCMFDAARFQKECMPHIRKIFDNLPFEERQEFTAQAEPSNAYYFLPWNNGFAMPGALNGRYRDPGQVIARYGGTYLTSIRFIPADSILKNRPKPLRGQYSRTIICLNVSPKYRPGSQRYICYASDKVINLDRVLQRKKIEIEGISVSLCLLDGDGQEVRRMTKRFTERDNRGYYEPVYFGIYPDYRRTSSMIISPEIFQYHSSYNTNCSPVTILPLSTEIDVEDLKEIKSFKLEVNMSANQNMSAGRTAGSRGGVPPRRYR